MSLRQSSFVKSAKINRRAAKSKRKYAARALATHTGRNLNTRSSSSSRWSISRVSRSRSKLNVSCALVRGSERINIGRGYPGPRAFLFRIREKMSVGIYSFSSQPCINIIVKETRGTGQWTKLVCFRAPVGARRAGKFFDHQKQRVNYACFVHIRSR